MYRAYRVCMKGTKDDILDSYRGEKPLVGPH